MGQWFVLFVVLLAVYSAGHVVLYKRDTRAVIAWVALIVLLPAAGAILYWLLAVNRIERRARKLRPRPAGHVGALPIETAEATVDLQPLARVGDAVTPFRLCAGNAFEALENGDAAYPAMLEAINGAQSSITLATYIFDGDATGERFGTALVGAVQRGVAVRVLLDSIGRLNRRGDMFRWLERNAVPTARFMPALLSPTLAAFNMRNHRKLMVVDGAVAFTGGMNITGDHLLSGSPSHPVQDLHFSLRGPVVTQLQKVFADDWEFTTGEQLEGSPWFAPPRTEGAALARAIPDGPDEQFEAMKIVLLGAIAQARHRLAVVTPYFLPDNALIAALNTAALRGVQVDILLPIRNDHRSVKWASQALYWQVLERGCRIFHSPPPFDHSKLMLVDDAWALIGSTNWDPRSLRLNFELNVECHDAAFAKKLWVWFERRRDAATPVTKAEMDGRALPLRLRDGAARLLTPYL